MTKTPVLFIICLSFLTVFSAFETRAEAEKPVEVKLVQSEDGWSLERAGQPYRIRGAGGNASLEQLARLGGNSTRTWGIDQLEAGKLDEAWKAGLTAVAGIWLRHDLDYSDEAQVAEQTRLAVDAVRQYKNHPAVLLWGIGNEMEGGGDRLEVWRHIETLAALIKKEDPLHPTMTVIAEIGGPKLKNLHQHCPSIDIVGINAYGGAASIPERYREAGGTKPYILAEYGPRGPWDFGKNAIGSVDEELMTVKAATYLKSYQAARDDTRLCLGSYAFKWGHKQEATPTWFGMFLSDGRKTPIVDVLAEEWSGQPVKNRSPRIESLTLEGGNQVKVKAVVKARLVATDPEKKPLQVRWVLMEDAKRHETAGYFQETPPSFDDHLLKTDAEEATFRVPDKPGLYRIFAYAGDGEGSADSANVVFRAEKE
ncbi:MAG: glycoside hydrolase family 2 TIM barrel-domain containing protein [Verrucomicrobiota bacterium]